VTAQPEQTREKLHQNGLIYSGLVGIGVVLIQPFLTVEPDDLSAKICALVFVAPLSAFVGITAGFWHILWVAGVVSLGAGVLGVVVYATGYGSLTNPPGGPTSA
jgi:hypothetical protein